MMTLFPNSNTKVTEELRDLVAAGVNIWDFEYPSYYKGEQKAAFEQKVLDHFWTRQIGQETVGRFLLFFRRTVREIMPYYIQRYESVDLMKDPEIRPLDNYNMVEEFEQETHESGEASNETTGSSSGTGTEKKTRAESVTPDGNLNWALNPSDPSTISLDYASNVQQEINDNSASESSESSGSTSSSNEGTSSHKLTRRGNIGVTTYAQLLEGYRQTFLNIDMEVISDLETCFLGVY